MGSLTSSKSPVSSKISLVSALFPSKSLFTERSRWLGASGPISGVGTKDPRAPPAESSRCDGSIDTAVRPRKGQGIEPIKPTTHQATATTTRLQRHILFRGSTTTVTTVLQKVYHSATTVYLLAIVKQWAVGKNEARGNRWHGAKTHPPLSGCLVGLGIFF